MLGRDTEVKGSGNVQPMYRCIHYCAISCRFTLTTLLLVSLPFFFCVFFFLVAVMLSQYTWSLVPIKPIELNCDLNMTEMNPSEQEYTV